MKTEHLENVAAVYIYIYIKDTINTVSSKNLGNGFHTLNILRNIEVSYA